MATGLANWLIVVPARLKSTRLPEKPLADLGGSPLIVRVVRNLAPLKGVGAEILVATDAESVSNVCAAHGIPCTMTSVAHESGTDRCAEAAESRRQPFILNVQGDEPFVDTDDLTRLCLAVETRPDAALGTLVYATDDRLIAADPNAVKAVRRRDGYALYFSRATIPYDRDAPSHLPGTVWQHLGVYAFPRARLEAFVKLPPSPLERTEKLEQLRALEAGWNIWLEPATHATRGIDTPEDLEAARARL